MLAAHSERKLTIFYQNRTNILKLCVRISNLIITVEDGDAVAITPAVVHNRPNTNYKTFVSTFT